MVASCAAANLGTFTMLGIELAIAALPRRGGTLVIMVQQCGPAVGAPKVALVT